MHPSKLIFSAWWLLEAFSLSLSFFFPLVFLLCCVLFFGGHLLVQHPLIWIACEFSHLLGRVIDQGGTSGGQNLACILPSAHPRRRGCLQHPGLMVGAGGAPQPPCLRLPVLWPVFTSHLYSLPPWPWPPFLSLSVSSRGSLVPLLLINSQSEWWMV